MPPRPAAAEGTLADGEQLFASGGEMGVLAAALDWSATAIGEPAVWPQSLRTVVGVCLASRFPILVWWGPELVMIYNDGYRPILGAVKHPGALGQAGAECWPEIWDVIGPMLEGVMATGTATWSEDQLLLLDRNGFEEECYFTFSYSPIPNEAGEVGGVFTAVFETTERVVGERRLACLRALAEARAEASSTAEAVAGTAAVLDTVPADIAFACIYPVEAGAVAERGTCVGCSSELGSDAWPTEALLRGGGAVTVTDLGATAALLHGDRGSQPVAAVVTAIREAGGDLRAVLVCGVNPRRPLDAAYRAFLALVAEDLEGALAAAHERETESRRVAALAELDEAKTKFFSNVSHEFRTPLTLLLGPLEDLLGDGGALTDAQRAAVTLARVNALRMRRLVNSLLSVSQAERGRLEPRFREVALGPYTGRLAAGFSAAAATAGLTLAVGCEDVGEVHVDPQMWDEIVLNLISNALKHTWEGSISISLTARDGAVRLQVSDTGTGIPADELPRLFERFHQVRGARSRSSEGSGIGLALVNDLVALHDGEVLVDSELGVGSTFTVSIPVRERETGTEGTASAPVDPSRVESFVADAERWLAVEDLDAGASATPPRGDEDDRGLVLVVDDNSDLRGYLRGLLSERFEVETAADGVQALRRIERRRPDLVLTDVMMPGLDGLGLVRAIREDPRTASLPVIVLSARAGQESAVGALDAGADDYLVKPFSPVELMARVRVSLETGRARGRATEQALRRAQRLDRLVGSGLRIDAQIQPGAVLTELAREARDLFGALAVTASDGRGTAESVGEQPLGAEEHVVALPGGTGAGGELRLTFAAGERLEAEDEGILAQLALLGAGALARARQHMTERDTVERLQESLLPQHLPVVGELQLAVRYLPASSAAAVGGDWYDVIALPGGRVAVVVGDVVGHGLGASATMSYLRSVLRAYLLEGDAPGQALLRLQALGGRGEPGLIATLCCLVADPATGAVTIASAGHPDPLLISASGATGYVDVAAARQPAIGVGVPEHPLEHELELAPGETLLLYTDGLIEPRDGSDGGLALPREARAPTIDLDAYCDLVIDRMAPREARRDDVALLALRRGRVEEAVLELRPHATPAAGGIARAKLREWLESLSVGRDVSEDVVAAVSEAVANAIEHSGISATQELSLRAILAGEELKVTVRDSGRWRAPRTSPSRGYGLGVMRSLMSDVVVDRRDDGTRVELTRRLTDR